MIQEIVNGFCNLSKVLDVSTVNTKKSNKSSYFYSFEFDILQMCYRTGSFGIHPITIFQNNVP